MLKPISIALDAMTPRVRAELTRPVQAYDPRNAEILANQKPRWHLIQAHEPAQRDVEHVLVERRFGIFVPEVETIEVKRGRKITRKSPLFPGYIFVFVWGIDRHWSRIAEIYGVLQIVSSKPDMAALRLRGMTIDEIKDGLGVTEKLARQAYDRARTAEMPRAIVIDDDMINYIRALENGERPIPKRRTRGKAKRQHDDDVMTTRPWSAFPDRLLNLDGEGRNQTLRKALGL